MNGKTSSAKDTSRQEPTLTASDVEEYLTAHPDFFNGRDHLLEKLTLPHESGKAISLLERQVTILRERSVESRHTLKKLMDNARDNDQLFNITKGLVLTLLEEDGIEQVASLTEANLATQPGVDACSLVFLEDHLGLLGVDEPHSLKTESRENLQIRFPTLFRSSNILCQAIDREVAQLLFPHRSGTIRSAALCPVSRHGNVLAILAIGNQAENYFNRELDTLFLDFIAQVLAAVISRR